MPVCVQLLVLHIEISMEVGIFAKSRFVFVSMNILILKNKKAGSHYPSPHYPFPCMYKAKFLRNHTLKFPTLLGITFLGHKFMYKMWSNTPCICHFLPLSC